MLKINVIFGVGNNEQFWKREDIIFDVEEEEMAKITKKIIDDAIREKLAIDEWEYLEKINLEGKKFNVVAKVNFYFDSVKFEVYGKTYEIKDKLKEIKFFWDAEEKVWKSERTFSGFTENDDYEGYYNYVMDKIKKLKDIADVVVLYSPKYNSRRQTQIHFVSYNCKKHDKEEYYFFEIPYVYVRKIDKIVVYTRDIITYILLDILSNCDLIAKLLTFRKENYDKMEKALSFDKMYVNRFRNLAKFLVEKNEINLLFSLLTYKKLKNILKETSDFTSLDLNELKKKIIEDKIWGDVNV
jgi:hypothetical protein